MASKKSELLGIYRLEFYRNKDKWKLASDRKKRECPQSSSEPLKSESARNLNKANVKEKGINAENEISPLSNHTNIDSVENPPEIEFKKPKSDFWINDPASGAQNLQTQHQAPKRDNSSFNSQNIRSGAPLAEVKLFQQKSSFVSSSASHLLDTGTQENLKRQGQNVAETSLEIKSKKPNSSSNSQNICTGALSADSELFQKKSSLTQSSTSLLHDTEILANLPKRQGQNVEGKKSYAITQDPPTINLYMWSSKSHEEVKFKGSLPSPEKYPIVTWCGDQEEPEIWNNPNTSSNPEAIRPYGWSNGPWQKPEDPYLLQEWTETFKNGSNYDSSEAPDEVDLHYYAEKSNTLKPYGSLNSEMLTPEQVRQCTEEWLLRMLVVHQPNNYCNLEYETRSDQNQGDLNDSINFIREAHDVPHSSEKDPDETQECMCSCLPTRPLPTLSSRRLSAALQHSTRILSELLREQVIRDRLRSLTLLNMVEYPTHDTNLFGSEYVMGASHIPHCTSDLDPGKRNVIGINMGRPYRL